LWVLPRDGASQCRHLRPALDSPCCQGGNKDQQPERQGHVPQRREQDECRNGDGKQQYSGEDTGHVDEGSSPWREGVVSRFRLARRSLEGKRPPKRLAVEVERHWLRPALLFRRGRLYSF